MKVEIYSHTRNFSHGELFCTWTLNQDGDAVCDSSGDQETLEKVGAISDGKIYYPKDGEAFLRALPADYRSSTFMQARLIE